MLDSLMEKKVYSRIGGRVLAGPWCYDSGDTKRACDVPACGGKPRGGEHQSPSNAFSHTLQHRGTSLISNKSPP